MSGIGCQQQPGYAVLEVQNTRNQVICRYFPLNRKPNFNIFKNSLDIVEKACYYAHVMFKNKKNANRLISECPVCSGRLSVTHLRCNECDTELNGVFMANEFARLPQDKLEFLRTFLSCRGNLKEVEAVLNISYPTVRGRLDQLLASLGMGDGAYSAGDGSGEAEEDEQSREEILAALERGDMSVEEAESLLRD